MFYKPESSGKGVLIMCVICVKPKGVEFPKKEYLKNCFDNNSDGAGIMTVWKGKVHIKKGFETFDKFWAALETARAKTGDKAPYVMHFRIATQGFNKQCTHPFPLSSKMANLKKLRTSCNIGVAHNGIISLTSDRAADYSDTMKFITDYMSLIVRSYSWDNDERNVKLLNRLIKGSRIATLDKNGKTVLLGEGWVKDGDVYYSNKSYSYEKPKYVYNSSAYNWYDEGYWDSVNKQWMTWDYKTKRYVPANAIKATQTTSEVKEEPELIYEDWESFKNPDGNYDFTQSYCPVSEEDDDSYCLKCKGQKNCAWFQAAITDVTEQQALDEEQDNAAIA